MNIVRLRCDVSCAVYVCAVSLCVCVAVCAACMRCVQFVQCVRRVCGVCVLCAVHVASVCAWCVVTRSLAEAYAVAASGGRAAARVRARRASSAE